MEKHHILKDFITHSPPFRFSKYVFYNLDPDQWYPKEAVEPDSWDNWPHDIQSLKGILKFSQIIPTNWDILMAINSSLLPL